MMFPGMGKINPKQMQAMMKQFGIKSEPLEVKKVIFELEDKKLVIDNPSVTAVDMQGQKTYQVLGEAKEEAQGLPEEDVKMVAEQAGVSEEEAKAELEKTEGDIAQAITNLKKE
jgi:nascent polypeptide-associated complex subunit alpha